VVQLFWKSFHFWVSYITFWNFLKIPSVFNQSTWKVIWMAGPCCICDNLSLMSYTSESKVIQMLVDGGWWSIQWHKLTKVSYKSLKNSCKPWKRKYRSALKRTLWHAVDIELGIEKRYSEI
jgi:hypothetical protein